MKRHPKGMQARVLLTSLFAPYVQDDAYRSRSINPMELYHNQVTRVQGPFSLRMFHRSSGIMMIQANIDAPSTLLDLPLLDRFIQEIRENEYDIFGISAIIPNLGKVRKMCSLVREYLPRCRTVNDSSPKETKAVSRDAQSPLSQETRLPYGKATVLSELGSHTLESGFPGPPGP